MRSQLIMMQLTCLARGLLCWLMSTNKLQIKYSMQTKQGYTSAVSPLVPWLAVISGSDFKMNRECLTVMLCANASGKYLYELLVIGKSKKKNRAFKNLRAKQPVIYDGEGNTWTLVPAIKHYQLSPTYG